jgi:2-desacetyl-2-hydroxyethyl bacteriochlorophyllide A dehydrogenase
MKAAVFYGPGGSWPQKPMRIEERPIPTIGPKDVLVKVAACGLCRTDLEYLKVEGSTPKPPPIILGHEPSGIVVEIGAEVSNVNVGSRVLITPSVPCLSCTNCRNGHENLCSNMLIIGADCDGAFAEYVVAPALAIYSLPDELPLEESAIITDAVGASYHAVYEVAEVRPGDTVVVYGASGGLGIMCVQFAHAVGATVIGVGRKRWKLDKAKELGASMIIATDEVDRVSREVRRITGIGADIAIDVTGIPSMVEEALKSTRPGGKIVEAGFGFGKFELSINRLMWHELKVLGSKNYNAKDMPKIINLVKNGVIQLGKSVSHRFKLEEINEAYQMLEKGELLRAIVIP